MRNEIYQAIKNRIEQRVPEVKHIDLWNQNVAFAEQDTAWERPAVFVEFLPISWQPLAGRNSARGRGRIQLHVVTDWSDDDESNAVSLQLSDTVAKAMVGMVGDKFDGVELQTTYTNHNHEELVENIEEFSYRCLRSFD